MVTQKLVPTRSQAKQLIESGKVTVNNEPAKKASQSFSLDSKIQLAGDKSYVSRGAYKLEAALQHFQIDPKNLTIADIGASTGGFTDLLLQLQAKKIYAIDVGTNQLSPKLQNDSRVINMEGTDIRNVKSLLDAPEITVIDLSFISLTLVLPHIAKLLQPKSPIIALFKPQFEAGPDQVPKDGVIKDPATLKKTLQNFQQWCDSNNFQIQQKIPAPIKGKQGNQEYLLLLNQK